MGTIKLSRMTALTTFSAIVALAAWSGTIGGLIAAPLLVLAWRHARSRLEAFAVCLAYYLAAGRGLFRGASVFFGEDSRIPPWLSGAAIWITPACCWLLRGHSHGARRTEASGLYVCSWLFRCLLSGCSGGPIR